MGTAIKHPVPDRVKPSFVIFTSGHSDAQDWASECRDVKNYKWRLNPVWHRMLYSCTQMAKVGFKGLNAWRWTDYTHEVLLLHAISLWCLLELTTVTHDLPFLRAISALFSAKHASIVLCGNSNVNMASCFTII